MPIAHHVFAHLAPMAFRRSSVLSQTACQHSRTEVSQIPAGRSALDRCHARFRMFRILQGLVDVLMQSNQVRMHLMVPHGQDLEQIRTAQVGKSNSWELDDGRVVVWDSSPALEQGPPAKQRTQAEGPRTTQSHLGPLCRCGYWSPGQHLSPNHELLTRLQQDSNLPSSAMFGCAAYAHAQVLQSGRGLHQQQQLPQRVSQQRPLRLLGGL